MYVPKNKIITDLFTQGGEYALLTTNEEYTGYYHKLWDGTIYTGKNTSDPPNELLILLTTNIDELFDKDDEYFESTNKIALFVGDTDPLVLEEDYNAAEVYTYFGLRGGEINNDNPRNMPTPFYPIPTQENYNLKEFRRYFVKKINSISYTEIDEETYNNINSKDNNWVWELFIPFFLTWQISGNRKQVIKTNRNMVKLLEFNEKIIGLGHFLKYNYLKYYLYAPQNDLYTEGGILVLPNGINYTGYYHINSKLGPMVGKYHLDTPHKPLYWKDTFKEKSRVRSENVKPFQSKTNYSTQ